MTLRKLDARRTEKGDRLVGRDLTHLWGHDAAGASGKVSLDWLRVALGAFDTEADFTAANIPPQVNSVFVYGYSAVGDGGQHEKKRVSRPGGAGIIANAKYNTGGLWTFDGQATSRWSFVLNPQGVAPTKRALRSSGADVDASVGAAYQRGILAEYYPVTAGKNYICRGTLDSALTPKGTGQVSVFWYTSGNVFISSNVAFSAAASSIGIAQNFTGSAVAPATAAYARIVCDHVRDGSNIIGGTIDFYNLDLSEVGVVYPSYKQSADGAWWQIVPGDVIRLEMFGAFPHIECEAETKAWHDACATKPSYLHLMHHDRHVRRMKWRDFWDDTTEMLCSAGQTKADSAINMKTATVDVTYGGTLTHTPGYGITGDGTSGYISLPAWNTLLAQDNGTIALYSIGGTTTGYVVSSNAGGSGANITINPYDVSGNYLVRFMNNANVWGTASSKDGVRILTRSSSAGFNSYYDDEIFKRYPTATSTTLTTSTGLLLSSGLSQFSNHTVRMFVAMNRGLTDIEADALSLFIRLYVDGLSGVIGKGPSCDSIGFTVRTSDTDMAAAFDAATDFAQLTGAKVMLGYGTYLASDSYPIKGNVHTFGVSRRGTIIRQTAAANNLVPVYGPRHKRGGEAGSVIHNLCLDGATTARGHVIGNSPGGSGISTLGTSYGEAYDLDIIEAVLHGIDLCNNGELQAGVPKYSAAPSASKRDVGIASHGWQIKRIHLENWGDDAVTFHYSHSSHFEDISGYFASGRIGYENSMVVEADDGCWGITVRGVYARGVPHAVGIKCHADNPPPSGIKMYDVVAEMCGRGCSIYSSAGVGVGDFGEDNHIDGLRYTRPADWAPGLQEVMPLYISNMKHVTAKNIYFSARVGDAFLWRGIYVSAGAQNVLVDGFTGVNWVVPDGVTYGSTTLDGATVRVSGGPSDVTFRNGTLLGCGKYAIWDSGSTRPDYDNIRLGGTSVAGSIGFWISTSVAASKATNRAIKVISGFATEQTIVA